MSAAIIWCWSPHLTSGANIYSSELTTGLQNYHLASRIYIWPPELIFAKISFLMSLHPTHMIMKNLGHCNSCRPQTACSEFQNA